MPYGLIVTLVIVAIAAVTIAVAVYKIKRGIENVSRNLFGTSSFTEGLNKQKRQMSETPRSLQAMTRLELPRIKKDFPEFDYEEYKRKTQSLLRSYFNAIEDKKPSLLSGECSDALINSVEGIVADLDSSSYSQIFNEVVIHNTEISRYSKNGATATIKFVTAVGYYAYTQDANGKVVYGDKDIKTQTVYETELVYVQDVEKMGVQGSAMGLTCPNCGAPIKNLGQKFCEYCGTGVTEVNIRSWKFDSVKEQTMNKKIY